VQLRALYELHGEKLRYLVVGVMNTVIGYAIFWVLLGTVGPPLHALSGFSASWISAIGREYYLIVQWAGWVLAVPVSTTTMKYLAFRSKGKWLPQVGRAYFVYLPAQGIATVVLWASVKLAGLSPEVGQLATIAVTTVFSYLGHKYFTFRTPLEVGEVAEQELLEER
jgi:putative flippase GtrA